jgi:hypothetical protein
MYAKPLIPALALLLAAPTARAADPANPHVWEPQVKSVAVFKNGFGFFLRAGDVRLRDGWCYTQHLPPAVLSTLAVYAHDEADAVDVVGTGAGEEVEFDGRDAPATAEAKRARLEASKLLKVQLTYDHKGTSRTAAGQLMSVGPEFVVLEHEANSFAVPLDGIKKMQVLELPLRVHVSRDPKDAGRPATLGMAYLRKGITWIPEYTLRVLDDTTVELTLRGTLVNEAEDLVHTEVQFVVGVPHFLHSEYLEPVSVGQVIRTVGSAVAPAQVATQIMNRAAIANNTVTAPQFDAPGVVERPAGGEGRDVRAAAGNLPQLDAPGAASDFTVYTMKDLTVRRGEKAVVTLFRQKLKYTHLYRWHPPEKIEHSLVLLNDADTPLTTGPFVAVSGSRPLAQDLLRYTPKGGRCEVPITAAINVATDQTEAEVDRKLKAHTLQARDRYLDLVTLQGELRVRNFEKRPIEVLVKVTVPGKPVSASDGGALSANATKLTLSDREGTVSWRVELKPGEGKRLEYKYERYVPSQ